VFAGRAAQSEVEYEYFRDRFVARTGSRRFKQVRPAGSRRIGARGARSAENNYGALAHMPDTCGASLKMLSCRMHSPGYRPPWWPT
jgi:hypothetical protein